MLYNKFASAALLLGSMASASHLHERHVHDLKGRGEPGGHGGTVGIAAAATQSFKFAPSTQKAVGDTCASAFGSGFETCREASNQLPRLCYKPAAGQQCCSASWSCPEGSFCLDGACCPNGKDPTNCSAIPSTSTNSTTTNSTTSSSTWSSTATNTSSTCPSKFKSMNAASLVNSTKPYPLTFANITSTKPFVVASGIASVNIPANISSLQTGGATHAVLSAAGLLGACVVALLATF